MRKNQKLGLVAVAFLVAGFGTTWYFNKDKEAKASNVEPTMTVVDPAAKQMKFANLSAPAQPSRVEKQLKGRWDHLGEDILTTAAVEADGTMVFFDKELRVGLDGNGNKIYAIGAHRLHKMTGPVIKSLNHEPTKATRRGVTPGSGYFMQALTQGEAFKPENRPAAGKTPAGQ